MKKKTFYLALVILVCVGAIANFAIAGISSKNLINVCEGDGCTETLKEYTPLTIADTEPTKEPGAENDEAKEDETKQDEKSDEQAVKSIDSLSFIAGAEAETEEDAIYKHNTFIAGQNVTTNQAGVDGILFSVGNKVRLHGAQDYLFSAGNDVSVDAITEKDLFFAGNIVDFSKEAEARDVFGVGNQVTLRGKIDGSVNVAGARVVFDNAVIGSDVNLQAAEIEFKGNSLIYGTLNYNSNAVTTNLEKDKIAGIKTYTNPGLNLQKSPVVIALETISGICVTTVAICMLAIFLAASLPKRYEALKKNATGFKDLLLGLVALIIVPSVLLILLFVNYLSLLGALGMLVMLIFFIVGAAVAAIRFGKVVEKNIIKTKAPNVYSTVLIGAVSFALLCKIPVLGSMVICFAIIAGFGYMLGETIHAVLPTMRKITGKK